jgi:hypothetical protein
LIVGDVLDPDALAEQFGACRLSKREWTHQAHLAVGLWHVSRFGPDCALAMLRTGIRRLNDSHGTVNSDTSGYHETVTAAYVRLLDRYLAAGDRTLHLRERCAAVLASRLADRDVLLRFYSKAVLMSPTARREWVEPDVAPLTLEGWL